LYSRGGNRKKAMDLAIKYNLGHLLEEIQANSTEDDDPEVLKSSVQFLIQNKQYEKAVEAMIALN